MTPAMALALTHTSVLLRRDVLAANWYWSTASLPRRRILERMPHRHGADLFWYDACLRRVLTQTKRQGYTTSDDYILEEVHSLRVLWLYSTFKHALDKEWHHRMRDKMGHLMPRPWHRVMPFLNAHLRTPSFLRAVTV